MFVAGLHKARKSFLFLHFCQIIFTLLPNKSKVNPGDHFLHLFLPQQYVTLTASTYKLPKGKILVLAIDFHARVIFQGVHIETMGHCRYIWHYERWHNDRNDCGDHKYHSNNEGTEEFEGLRVVCYDRADVFIVCYSLARPASANNVRSSKLIRVLSS